jgi:hypothetical protein
MPKYKITLQRTVIQTAEIEIEADTEEQATEMAYDNWENVEWDIGRLLDLEATDSELMVDDLEDAEQD